MTKSTLIWIFKLLGALLVSIILWDLFIGSPSNATDRTDTGNYAHQGTRFEEIAYTTGFSALSSDTWMKNTNNNGYWNYVYNKGITDSTRLTTSGGRFISGTPSSTRASYGDN